MADVLFRNSLTKKPYLYHYLNYTTVHIFLEDLLVCMNKLSYDVGN